MIKSNNYAYSNREVAPELKADDHVEIFNEKSFLKRLLSEINKLTLYELNIL